MNPPTTTKAAGLSNLLTTDEEYAAPRLVAGDACFGDLAAGCRPGKSVPRKGIVDQARDGLGPVDQAVVFHRTGGELHHFSTIEQ